MYYYLSIYINRPLIHEADLHQKEAAWSFSAVWKQVNEETTSLEGLFKTLAEVYKRVQTKDRITHNAWAGLQTACSTAWCFDLIHAEESKPSVENFVSGFLVSMILNFGFYDQIYKSVYEFIKIGQILD